MRFKAIFLAAMLTWTGAAQAGGPGGGALEITQLANKAQLISQVSESVRTNAQLAQQYVTMVQQYQTMLQNLKTMPSWLSEQIFAPYKNDQNRYQGLANTSMTTHGNLEWIQSVLTNVRSSIGAGTYNPEDYILTQYWDAHMRGENYLEAYRQQETIFLETAQKLYKLDAMSRDIDTIQGARDGMQVNARILSVLGAELNEINRTMRQMYQFQIETGAIRESKERALRAYKEWNKGNKVKELQQIFENDANQTKMPIL